MWIREKSNFITLEYVLSLLRCKKLVMVLPSFRLHNRDSVFFTVVFSCSRSPLFSSLSCCFIVNAASSRLFHWPREKSRDWPMSLWSANPCLSILQFNRPVSVLQHFWRKFLFLLYSFIFLETIKMFRYRNVLSVFIFWWAHHVTSGVFPATL